MTTLPLFHYLLYLRASSCLFIFFAGSYKKKGNKIHYSFSLVERWLLGSFSFVSVSVQKVSDNKTHVRFVCAFLSLVRIS